MNDASERTPDNRAPDTGPPWLSALDAAVVLGVNERTVRRAILRGDLPATKRSGVWRIDPADISRLQSASGRTCPPPRAYPSRPLLLLPQVATRPPFIVPIPRNPLLGREQEIAAVGSLLLHQRVPLVTLTGPGGIGKTRLALAIAFSLRDQFSDGIWFVDLSGVRDFSLVPGAIAQVIGLTETAGEYTSNRLRRYLQSRTSLIVLDNVEQVPAAGLMVSWLLTNCPDLQVLATSRIPLHVTMEHLFTVSPLDLPTLGSQPTRDAVEAASATRLFLLVAQQIRPGFHLTDADSRAIATLCTRLDGLPLAIELAAAQSTMYAPSVLLERLNNHLNVLDHGPIDAPQRLRSMHDAIGWSYDLLPEHLQLRFRRLSVFVGGFTLSAAAVVTSRPPLDLLSLEADLKALIDASLVVAHPETNRFTMLETIRSFGQFKLETEDDPVPLHREHARWCLDQLLIARPHWFTPNQTQVAELVEKDHANLREATNWLHREGYDSDLVELIGLMWPFWFVRHHWPEGMTWLEKALEASTDQRTLARLRILVGAGCLWLMRGDEPAARAFNDEALAISQELGEWNPIDSPLNGLAICANVRGDFDEGRRFNLEALAMLRAQARDEPQALPMISVILSNMASIHFSQRHMDEAERLVHEALEMQRELGFDWAAAETLLLDAHIGEAKGQLNRAALSYREALRLAVETRDLQVIVRIIDRYTDFLIKDGDHQRVAVLLGASTRLHDVIGDVQRHDNAAELSRLKELSLERLGDADYDRLFQHGLALPLDHLTQLIQEATLPVPPSDVPAPAARWGVTRRELDVLNLLAQNLTDQEIADRLYISRRTVNSHVSRLLARLGVSTRRQAVSVAHEHQLIETSLAAGSQLTANR